MKIKKKVLLHAYTMENLGDDLFIRVIANRYPSIMFYLPTLNTHYKRKLSDLPNVKVVDFFGISKLTSRKTYVLPKLYSAMFMNKFDAVVCIGGSMFIDRQNPTEKDRKEAENYSFIADWKAAYKKKVPYYILGSNWGPCYNDYFRDYFSQAFDTMEDICFRDSYSYNEFSDKKNVRYTGDILLDNDYIKSAVCKTARKKQIAVSIIDPSRKREYPCDNDKYVNALARVCNGAADLGYDVVLMSFCKFEGDEDTVCKVMEKAQNGRVRSIFYSDNWKQMLQTIAESEIMLATRFHATVLAWTLGTPTFTIAYSGKTINLLNDCGCTDAYAKIGDIVSMQTEDVIVRATLPELNEDNSGAEKTFLRIDELLSEEQK